MARPEVPNPTCHRAGGIADVPRTIRRIPMPLPRVLTVRRRWNCARWVVNGVANSRRLHRLMNKQPARQPPDKQPHHQNG